MDHILREQAEGAQNDITVIGEEIGPNVTMTEEKLAQDSA
jgi:hypothetical protein